MVFAILINLLAVKAEVIKSKAKVARKKSVKSEPDLLKSSLIEIGVFT